jgi:hypothetical protein
MPTEWGHRGSQRIGVGKNGIGGGVWGLVGVDIGVLGFEGVRRAVCACAGGSSGGLWGCFGVLSYRSDGLLLVGCGGRLVLNDRL